MSETTANDEKLESIVAKDSDGKTAKEVDTKICDETEKKMIEGCGGSGNDGKKMAATNENGKKKANAGDDDGANVTFTTVESDVAGTVKFFLYRRGFGFIECNDGGERVFMHCTAIADRSTKHNASRFPGRGDIVKFDIVKCEKGIEARNVVITESVETPADDVAAPRKRRQRRRSLVAADDHQESSEKTATGESEKTGEKPARKSIRKKKTVANEKKTAAVAKPTTTTTATTGKKTVVETGVHGVVQLFLIRRGYGFIKRNDNKEDLFVHRTAIVANNPNKYTRTLDIFEEVEFDVIQTDKGFEAANVTGPKGACVRGSRYAPDKGRPRGGRSSEFVRTRHPNVAGNGHVGARRSSATASDESEGRECGNNGVEAK